MSDPIRELRESLDAVPAETLRLLETQAAAPQWPEGGADDAPAVTPSPERRDAPADADPAGPPWPDAPEPRSEPTAFPEAPPADAAAEPDLPAAPAAERTDAADWPPPPAPDGPRAGAPAADPPDPVSAAAPAWPEPPAAHAAGYLERPELPALEAAGGAPETLLDRPETASLLLDQQTLAEPHAAEETGRGGDWPRPEGDRAAPDGPGAESGRGNDLAALLERVADAVEELVDMGREPAGRPSSEGQPPPLAEESRGRGQVLDLLPREPRRGGAGHSVDEEGFDRPWRR